MKYSHHQTKYIGK